jgi:Tfp pilus assembly protein PilF/TolB-like protein
VGCALLFLLCTVSSALAQAQESGGRVVLVLPFDNRSGQSTLDWIGESFAETISQRLTSAGFLTISRDDRAYALDHLGLPAGFRPSRATTIRIAQTLDAEFVIVGSYSSRDGRVSAQAQVVRVNALQMTAPMDDSVDLPRLLDLENSIAWKCARQMDPKFAVALSTFLSASQDVKLDAYESYIRGISAANDDERLKRLQAAVTISPNYAAALLALGKAQYRARDYDVAAATLAKVPPASAQALEAGFYRGLAKFNSAHYADAETAFAFVASRLPLPEIVNNQGVAAARQKKDGTVLLQRASAADPQEADYHFNLAVALRRRNDLTNARNEADRAVQLKPKDAEAVELRNALAVNAKTNAGYDPQERIRRTYSEASFRQAAFQLDQMRAIKLATLPPAERAAQIVQVGQDYLAQGLIPEAEREFQEAVDADRNNATAHAGLAQVRERTGAPEEARKEARLSLDLKPSVTAYLVLARLDLQSNQLAASAASVSNALRLEPKNGAALGMKQALAARGTQLP